MEDILIDLTENDMRVMSCMFDKDTGMGLSKSKSITIDEIKLNFDKLALEKGFNSVSKSKIRNATKKLIACNCVDIGIKKGLKKTYHVTTYGFNYVREIKKTVITINKDKKLNRDNNEEV